MQQSGEEAHLIGQVAVKEQEQPLQAPALPSQHQSQTEQQLQMRMETNQRQYAQAQTQVHKLIVVSDR